MFVIAAVLGSGGIFFRYAMNLSFGGELHLDTLFVQTLQVCNFNFILLPLMLIPKFELARQYSIYFSMFAACTTLFSIPKSYASYEWNDPALLNFWFNHVFAIALPIWMLAAGRLIPQRKYIPHMSLAVFCYFTSVYAIGSVMMALQMNTFGCSMSYVFDPKGMPMITQFYELIGVPYWHLLPVFFILIGFFFLWSMPFNRSVSFDPAGGSGKLRKRYGAIGTELQLPHGGFIREGFALIGWSDSPDGEICYAPGDILTVGKEKLTLYAVWEQLPEDT